MFGEKRARAHLWLLVQHCISGCSVERVLSPWLVVVGARVRVQASAARAPCARNTQPSRAELTDRKKIYSEARARMLTVVAVVRQQRKRQQEQTVVRMRI